MSSFNYNPLSENSPPRIDFKISPNSSPLSMRSSSTNININSIYSNTGSPCPYPTPHPVASPKLPLLLKSVTAPVLPSFKPQEQLYPKPTGCNMISSVELGKLISEHPTTDLLILDARPFSDHSKSFIKDSIRVCLPSTLLRRKNFTFLKLIENLSPIEQDIVNARLKNSNIKIIIYDNSVSQSDSSVSLGTYGISFKVVNYMISQNIVNYSVSILASGFAQFSLIYPDLVEQTVEHSNAVEANTEYNGIACNSQGTAQPSSLVDNDGHNNSHSRDGSDNINLKIKVSDLNNTSSSSSYGSPTPQTNLFSDSPISSSSPISALFKFQLPTPKTVRSQFKFAQNEELMDLESYLSAVNINQECSRWNTNRNNAEEEEDDSKNNFQSFQFPKRSSESNNGQSALNTHTSDVEDRFKDKLSVQIKYSKLLEKYTQDQIDEHIPKWFQELMSRTKVQFASQFQKLDILEKKRLNSSISNRTNSSNGSSLFTTASHSKHDLEYHNISSHSSFSLGKPPVIPGSINQNQKRSQSQPDCMASFKRTWLRDIDAEENSDDEHVVISSGVELGGKNRYKDIFPYEHTRVRLKKSSISSMNTNSTIQNTPIMEESDIWDNYINANYLKLPHLELSNIMLTNGKDISNIKPPASENVRYIATQAPMLSTVHDFYTCVLSDRVPLILSLTNDYENGIEKCFRYWDERNYDGIKVRLLEEQTVPKTDNNIWLRRIQLTYDNDTKTYEVMQLQIKNWPDLGTLSDSTEVIQIIILKNAIIKKLMENHSVGSDYLPTILVHCSAGCGRTGTWCTIDSILTHLDVFDILQDEYKHFTNSSKVYDPIAWTINVFRKQRISMVQNINQFLFIYDCLLRFFILRLNDSNPNCKTSGSSFTELIKETNSMAMVEAFAEHKRNESFPIYI